MIAPDYVEPIEAWRVWLVDGDFRLRSVMFDTVWSPQAPLVATCLHRRRSWRPPWREVPVEHEAPELGCRCGIYGGDSRLRTRSYERFRLPGWAIGRVVGRVVLWGTVVECEHGWRASRAYPRRLCVPDAGATGRRRGRGRAAEDLALALTAYGVAVELVDDDEPERLAAPLPM